MDAVELQGQLELIKPWLEFHAQGRDIAEYTQSEFGVSPLQFTAVTLNTLVTLRINTDMETLCAGLPVGPKMVIAVAVPIPASIDAIVGFIQGLEQTPPNIPGEKITRVYEEETIKLELSVKRL
jgi:hypothetical protein